jgi:DNA invertase Pin-like site-specific DNA recombinase
MTTFIAYFRVSTDKQGVKGLGMEAQKDAVERYVESVDGDIVAAYTEVESGSNSDRPQLAKALAHARAAKAVLIIAKLDRLSRNLLFIAQLMESKVEFLACDFPQANKLMLHIMAAFAEHEREMISIRTKAALKAAKARGVRLGNPGTPRDMTKAWAARSANAAGRRLERELECAPR